MRQCRAYVRTYEEVSRQCLLVKLMFLSMQSNGQEEGGEGGQRCRSEGAVKDRGRSGEYRLGALYKIRGEVGRVGNM